MSDQKKPTVFLWLVLSLLALLLPLGLYFGLYHMVTAVHYGVAGKSFGVAVYRWNGTEIRQKEFAHTFFGPAHWVDRRVRLWCWYGVKPMISDSLEGSALVCLSVSISFRWFGRSSPLR